MDEALDMLLFSDSEQDQQEIQIVELPAGEIDPRLKLLSHSSRTTLHTCPRKYQLYRLSSNQIDREEEQEIQDNTTFAYGHAVGAGIASVMSGKSEDQYILDTFLEWDTDLLSEDTKRKKSIWLAIFAVMKLGVKREQGFLKDWEVVEYKDKPAIELSFLIKLPGGFLYRGFVDAVLQHTKTKEIMVLECKTSSGTANPAMFKNSGQAVGYSVVLDILFPELSAYSVLYLVYETKAYEYKELPFSKSLFQRALWLQELLIDTQKIELYEQYGAYPMHGENCFSFFKECEYLGLCTLDTNNLTEPLTTKAVDAFKAEPDKYQFVVDFETLVASQIEKGEV